MRGPSRGGSRLRRSSSDRILAGVCGGIAESLGVDVALVRLAFVLATLLGGGAGLIAYVVLWWLLPRQDDPQEVLADRLERGEITAEQYRQMVTDIYGPQVWDRGRQAAAG